MKVQTLACDIQGPEGKLHTLIVSADRPAIGIAIVAHPNPREGGTHHNKVVQTIARTFARLGYLAYCPNLRGVGESEGEHGFGLTEPADILAIRAHAQATHPDLASCLWLAGFSFGSFVQAQVANQLIQAGTPAQGLILAGPAISRYTFPTVPADTLVIHGEHDEVIPLSDALNWARPQQLPLVVFPGVSHFFHGHLPLLQRWVENHILIRRVSN